MTKITLSIGFPSYHTPQRISVTMVETMKAENLAKQLAEYFNLNKRWKLVAFNDDKAPRRLDNNEEMKKFVSSNERIYFVPEIHV
jgi:hypothetical protein